MNFIRYIFYSISEAALQKKWKYLRDQFAVEFCKMPPFELGDNGNREPASKWPYFNQLMFLINTVRDSQRAISCGNPSRPTTSRAILLPEAPPPAIEANGDHFIYYKHDISPVEQIELVFEDMTKKCTSLNLKRDNTNPSSSFSGKKKKENDYNEKLMQIEQEKLNVLMEKNSRIDEDEDVLFFRSLLPHIKKITHENKLAFRGKIQEAVDKYAYKIKPPSVINGFLENDLEETQN